MEVIIIMGNTSSMSIDNKIDYKKIVLGILSIFLYIFLTKLPTPEGLTLEGQKALVLMLVAVIWWVFEIVPIGISAVLFTMLLDTLKIVPLSEALSNFTIATIFFILSTLIIAKAFIDSGLGKRISLFVSCLFGTKANMVLLSFMLPTAVISTVLVDIPTAIIFSSIAYSILQKNNCIPGKSNFGKAMMMGIPIASALGGFGTPAGSGINVLSISLLKSTANIDIGFIQWTIIGFPMAMILTFFSWFILTKMFPPEFEYVKGFEDVKEERKKLGPLSTAEKKFLVIFTTTIILWFTQGWTGISIPLASVLAAFTLFLPGINLVTWEKANSSVSWNVLLLLGAANTLGMAIYSQKGAEWIATTFLSNLGSTNIITILLAVSSFGIFSHLLLPVATAVVAVAIPVLSILASNLGINPAILALPIAFTASCVFLIPLDPIPLTTYDYKYWKLWDMPKPGIIISLLWIICNVIFMYFASLIGII